MQSTLRVFLIVVLSLIFLLAALPALFLLPAEIVLFNPVQYQKSLISNGVGERILPIAAQALVDREGIPGMSGFESKAASYLEEPDYEKIFGLILPKPIVEAQLSGLIFQLFDYLNFKNDTLSLVIDLRPIKAGIAGDHSKEVAEIVISSWPKCGLGDAVALGAFLLTADINSMPMCKLPKELQPTAVTLIQGYLPIISGKLPDSMDLQKFAPLPMMDAKTMRDIFTTYKLTRLFWRSSPLISVFILGLIAVTAWGSIRSVLNWTGAQLVQVGIGGCLIALILLGFVYYYGQNPPSISGGGGLGQMIDILLKSFAEIFNRFLLASVGVSLVVTLVGSGMVGFAFLIGRRKSHDQ